MVVKQRRATLTHIAEQTGVSTSTVWRALNGGARIDSRTRERIIAAANQLGYLLASEEVGPEPQSKGLAVVLNYVADGIAGAAHPALSMNHIQRTLYGIERCAEQHGYHLVLNTISNPDNPLPSSIRNRIVCGALLLGGVFSNALVLQIAAAVPAVMVNSFLPDGQIHAVHINYRQAASLAVQHLYELGHRRIALLNGPQFTNTSEEKFGGFLHACYRLGLPLEPELIISAAGFEYEDGVAAAEALLTRTSVSAVVAGTDLLAHGLIDVAATRGQTVPGTLSVVSLYNSEDRAIRRVSPALTGVQVPHEAIGSLAADRLLELLRAPQPPAALVLPAQLQIHQSTAAPAGTL